MLFVMHAHTPMLKEFKNIDNNKTCVSTEYTGVHATCTYHHHHRPFTGNMQKPTTQKVEILCTLNESAERSRTRKKAVHMRYCIRQCNQPTTKLIISTCTKVLHSAELIFCFYYCLLMFSFLISFLDLFTGSTHLI